MFALHRSQWQHSIHSSGHAVRYVLAGLLALILFLLLAAPARGWA